MSGKSAIIWTTGGTIGSFTLGEVNHLVGILAGCGAITVAFRTCFPNVWNRGIQAVRRVLGRGPSDPLQDSGSGKQGP